MRASVYFIMLRIAKVSASLRPLEKGGMDVDSRGRRADWLLGESCRTHATRSYSGTRVLSDSGYAEAMRCLRVKFKKFLASC